MQHLHKKPIKTKSPLTLHLSEDLKARLVQAARHSKKSLARFARETLADCLKTTSPGPVGKSSLYELSRDLCGSVTGGPCDLAGNKKHLNGYGSWKQ